MIFYIIFFIFAILAAKHIYEISNYNHNGILDQLQSATKEEIYELLKERNPLLIHNLGNKHDEYNNLSFMRISDDNPGHIIHDKNRYVSLKSFTNEKQIYIYKNPDLYDSLRLNKLFDGVYELFRSQIHCNKQYYLSLLKGHHSIPLLQNKHNIHLIHQIYGQSKLYLFNPKHKSDIIHKDNNQIKKYGQKINMTQGLVLYIPIEWLYFYETEDESIIGEIESDNYFTFFYNNLR